MTKKKEIIIRYNGRYPVTLCFAEEEATGQIEKVKTGIVQAYADRTQKRIYLEKES